MPKKTTPKNGPPPTEALPPPIEEPEALPPTIEPAHYFTIAEIKTYDFTGWDWRQLPYGCVKSARNGAVQGFTIVGKLKDGCVNCKRDTWTCDQQREDLCEECDFFLRDRNRQLLVERAKRNNLKPVNPFADTTENREFVFNPFKEEI